MDATESFSKSWENTKSIQWFLLKGILLITFAISVPFELFEYLMSLIGFWSPIFSFLSFIGSSLLTPFITIFLFRVFTYEDERHKSN